MNNEPVGMTVETIRLKVKGGKYQWRKQTGETYSPAFDTEQEARIWMTAKCGNSWVRKVTKFV